MRGVYEATISIAALATNETMMYITVPANKVVEILSIEVTNATNETNEQAEVTFSKISSLGSPTATTITPTKAEQGDQAASSTVKGHVTGSEPTYASGPAIEFGRKGFATLAGYSYAPVPEERPILAGGDSWGLKLVTTISAIQALCVLRFRELG